MILSDSKIFNDKNRRGVCLRYSASKNGVTLKLQGSGSFKVIVNGAVQSIIRLSISQQL